MPSVSDTPCVDWIRSNCSSTYHEIRRRSRARVDSAWFGSPEGSDVLRATRSGSAPTSHRAGGSSQISPRTSAVPAASVAIERLNLRLDTAAFVATLSPEAAGSLPAARGSSTRMPMSPLSPCGSPGCQAVCRRRLCPAHERVARRDLDARRGSPASRGYGAAWRRLARALLRESPACSRCGNEAQLVDHIVPKRDGGTDDASNLQPLCRPCHGLKTNRADGGFGNRRQARRDTRLGGGARGAGRGGENLYGSRLDTGRQATKARTRIASGGVAPVGGS